MLLENDSDAIIELLERYPYDNRNELELRERHYVETIKCVNKNIPTRTTKEYFNNYYENNKDQIAEYKRKYYETNKDVLNAKKNIKHACDCGGNYTLSNKSAHFKSIKHQKFVKKQSD